jgi:hypothetical protein
MPADRGSEDPRYCCLLPAGGIVYSCGDDSAPEEHTMAKKKTVKADKKAGYTLAMERLGDAIESLDEVQALVSGEASEFWVGIIFSAQTSLQLVAEMARESEKEAAKAAKAAKRPAKRR